MMSKLFRAAAIAAAFVTVFAIPAVHAIEAQEEFDAAARKGAIKLGELTVFRSFVNAARTAKFRDMAITNAKAAPGALSGDVRFFNLEWTIIIAGDGGAKSSFIAFEPKRAARFQDLYGNARGVKLLDMLTPERQILALAVGDIEIKSEDLPSGLRAFTDKLFEEKDYELKLAQGVNILAMTDIARSKPLHDSLAFLGAKSGKLSYRASLGANVLDKLLDGERPAPEVKLAAILPAFRPKIGNLIQIPADVRFELEATVSRTEAELGYSGTFVFEHAKNRPPVDLVLATTFKLEVGEEPKAEVTATIAHDKPLEAAFGVPWLTLSDYRMTFGVEAGALSVGFGGKTSIGSKNVDAFGSVQIGTATVGMPLPQTLAIAIDDGPHEIGELSLKDMAIIYNEMLKASGKRRLVPLSEIPDVAIAGTEVGKGPSIDLSFKASGDAGFDMSGALRVLGTNVATVERAFFKADTGIELHARNAGLEVGPIRFPSAEINVVLIADKEERSVPLPEIKVIQNGLSLFGSTSQVTMILAPNQVLLAANQDYGALFQFDFKATTGAPITNLTQLQHADFILNASLKSDLAKWFNGAGKAGVQKELGGLGAAASQAAADLKKARDDVNRLNGQIKGMIEQIQRERAGPQQKLRDAEAEVNKLNGTISAIDGRIAAARSRLRTCNQTVSVCVAVSIIPWGCTRHEDRPDIPARAWCEAQNVGPEGDIAALETAKAPVIASRDVAQKTLETVRKGLIAIPPELDPRVTALYAARDSALFGLQTAGRVNQEFGNLTAILSAGTKALEAPDIFAIEKSELTGSLRGALLHGKPVVLLLTYRARGERHSDVLAFSLTDPAFNARQMEVLALGLATHAILAEGNRMKIVPHAILAEVNKIYVERQQAFEKEVQAALADNNVALQKAADAATLGEAINLDQENTQADLKKRRKESADELSLKLAAWRAKRAEQIEFEPGDLLFYRFNASNDQFESAGHKIGNGWDRAKDIVAPGPGKLYLIRTDGALDLYTLTDQGQFAHDGTAQRKGSGWAGFRWTLGAGPNSIFAITRAGAVLVYNVDGEGSVRGPRKPARSGGGWDGFAKVFAGPDALYGIKPNGDLWYYPVTANGDFSAGGKRIGNGWGGFGDVFSGGRGVILAVKKNGDLFAYKHDANGTFHVANKRVGVGWNVFRAIYADGGGAIYGVK
jgi:hypothetical protein